MSTQTDNNKRIAKNTFFLYIRMFLIMGTTLYTSRIILQALGVEDYGIYNIVGGIVVLFTFINNAMVASTQRFLNFELGKGNLIEAKKIFSTSVTIHLLIACVFILFAETIGLWFLNTYIQIPEDKIIAANWVYQFSILAAIIAIIQTPYNAAIIAHEYMDFYAYISVLEVSFKLIVAFLIFFFDNRIIAYSIMITCVTLIIFLCYYLYCQRKIIICKYHYEYNKKRFHQLIMFSGWSLLGSVSNMLSQQGFSVLLNLFFGVITNAAMGIANQVSTAVYQFVSNFQLAFNPQIIKLYAANQQDQFRTLITNASRYSYYLIFLITLPIFICCSEILHIWLVNVPEYAIVFCKIMIINSLFDALSGPLWVSVHASGKIKIYQIVISCLLSATVILAYVIAKMGGNPYWVLAAKPFMGGIIYLFRLKYCNLYLSLDLKQYLKEVIIPCLIITAACYIPSYFIYYSFNKTSLINMFNIVASSCIITIICIYLIGLKKNEKQYLNENIKKYVKINL